jgi:hypothetical protein
MNGVLSLERENEIYIELMTLETGFGEAVSEMLQQADETARLNDLSEPLLHLGRAAESYFRDGGGASGCFDAMRSLEQAIVVCENGVPLDLEYVFLKHEIGVLCKKVRDSLIVRTQLEVPIGDRKVFEEGLDAASGEGCIIDKKSKLHSILMLSYKKQIWERYPEEAFKSHTQDFSWRGGKTRPKRKCKYDRVNHLPDTLQQRADDLYHGSCVEYDS